MSKTHDTSWMWWAGGAGLVGLGVYALTRPATTTAVLTAERAVAQTAKKAARRIMDVTALAQVINAAKSAWGVVPSVDLLRLVAQAAAPVGVPLEVFTAFMRNESSLKTKGVFRQEKGSYSRWKDKQAPGSDKTWGQLYTEAEWGSYGPMQLMPFNFVGTPGGLTPGEPLTKGHDTVFNFTQAARLIRDLWKKYGNWRDVFSAYNSNKPFGSVTSSMFYTLHVATYLRAIGLGGVIGASELARLQAAVAAQGASDQGKRWAKDLAAYQVLPEPPYVAPPVVAPSSVEAAAPSVAQLQADLEQARLLRDLPRVAQLEQQLESLTAKDGAV